MSMIATVTPLASVRTSQAAAASMSAPGVPPLCPVLSSAHCWSKAGIIRRLGDVDDAIGLDEGDVGPGGEPLADLLDGHRGRDELETGDHPKRLQSAPIDPGHRRRATGARGVAAEPDQQPAWGGGAGRGRAGGCLPGRRRPGRRAWAGVLVGHGGHCREAEREQRDERGRSGEPGARGRHAASEISGTRPGIRCMVAAGWVGNGRPSINHPGGGERPLVRRSPGNGAPAEPGPVCRWGSPLINAQSSHSNVSPWAASAATLIVSVKSGVLTGSDDLRLLDRTSR